MYGIRKLQSLLVINYEVRHESLQQPYSHTMYRKSLQNLKTTKNWLSLHVFNKKKNVVTMRIHIVSKWPCECLHVWTNFSIKLL